MMVLEEQKDISSEYLEHLDLVSVLKASLYEGRDLPHIIRFLAANPQRLEDEVLPNLTEPEKLRLGQHYSEIFSRMEDPYLRAQFGFRAVEEISQKITAFTAPRAVENVQTTRELVERFREIRVIYQHFLETMSDDELKSEVVTQLRNQYENAKEIFLNKLAESSHTEITAFTTSAEEERAIQQLVEQFMEARNIYWLYLSELDEGDLATPVARQLQQEYETAGRILGQRLADLIEDEGDIPPELRCGILHTLMENPVIDPTTPQTLFEREALTTWLNGGGHNTNPLTQQPLTPDDLVSDPGIKAACDVLLTKFPPD